MVYDDDDWVPDCTQCGDSDDVSGPDDDDEYYCSACDHHIDDDGDCVTDPCGTCDDDSESTCPWCGDEASLCTQDDDYAGQRIYTCCAVYFNEDGDLWPEENPEGDYCRACTTNLGADDCSKELCGNCCSGEGCSRHGEGVPDCGQCGDGDDVTGPDDDNEYYCSACDHHIDDDGDCVTDPCETCDEYEDIDCPSCGNSNCEIYVLQQAGGVQA